MNLNDGKLNDVTRYFDSAFLNHEIAELLLESFLNVLNNFDLRTLLQVSMDDRNVNLKFLQFKKNICMIANQQHLCLLSWELVKSILSRIVSNVLLNLEILKNFLLLFCSFSQCLSSQRRLH